MGDLDLFWFFAIGLTVEIVTGLAIGAISNGNEIFYRVWTHCLSGLGGPWGPPIGSTEDWSGDGAFQASAAGGMRSGAYAAARRDGPGIALHFRQA